MLNTDAITFDVPEGVTRKLQILSGKAREDFWRERVSEGRGELIGLNATKAAGHDVLLALIRYPGPELRHPLTYAVLLSIPFDDCHAEIEISAFEHGTTGVRESTALMMQSTQPGRWPMDPEDSAYDPVFPAHPLSLVRFALRQVLATLAIAQAN